MPTRSRVLRRLFRTLFLRGRTRRQEDRASPRTIVDKLAVTLLLYAGLGGFMALAWGGRPVLTLSLYLHAATLFTVGLFVLTSAGEALFNRDEKDVLFHRPVPADSILRAKVLVLIEIALWIAAATNLAGLLVGGMKPDGGLRFSMAHALSVALHALFCAGSVVLIYEAGLSLIGRERLDSIMTGVQVAISILIVAGSQLLPDVTGTGPDAGRPEFTGWTLLFPPVWFAALDDALAGSGAGASWLAAVPGLVGTPLVLWLALFRLAGAYHRGLTALGDAAADRRVASRRSRSFAAMPVLGAWLRDPVSRASFRLTGAYLFRDPEMRLRLYPSLALTIVLPVLMMFKDFAIGSFGVAFAGTFLAVIPLIAVDHLCASRQWPAADIFRIAPLAGPGALSLGVRHAAIVLLGLPALLAIAAVITVVDRSVALLPLLLPGSLALPVGALVPSLRGTPVPLARPPQESKSLDQFLLIMTSMVIAGIVGGLGALAHRLGWLPAFLIVEAAIVAVICRMAGRRIDRADWTTAT